MRFKNSITVFLVLVFVLSVSSAVWAFDLMVPVANGFYRVSNFKEAFRHFDACARKLENKVTAADNDGYLIGQSCSEKEQLKKGEKYLKDSFYCYYMAGMSLEKLGRSAEAVNYYIKALCVTKVRKPVTFVNFITRKKTVKNIVIGIEPEDLGRTYDRIYELGIDAKSLLEKIRAIGEIRRDLAALITGGIDPEKQDEYRARFEVCMKSEKNLCTLAENFIIYEMNRGIYDRFDVLVKYLNEFKPITHAVDGIFEVSTAAKRNLINIIANSENQVSQPSVPELKQKLSELGEIIDYIGANIK